MPKKTNGLHAWLCMSGIMMLTLCLFGGCESVNETESDTKQISEEEQINNDIKILIELMAAPTPKIGEICRRLIEYEGKAVPHLARSLNSNDPLQLTWCLYCLGEIYKQHQFSAIKALRSKLVFLLQDPTLAVRLEAASLLCDIGDNQGIPILIQALRNEQRYIRMQAARVLQYKFETSFGYIYSDEPAVREKAVVSWEKWWQEKSRK